MTETGTTKPMKTPLDMARELAGWGFVVLPALARWMQIDAIGATNIDAIEDIAIDQIDAGGDIAIDQIDASDTTDIDASDIDERAS